MNETDDQEMLDNIAALVIAQAMIDKRARKEEQKP